MQGWIVLLILLISSVLICLDLIPIEIVSVSIILALIFAGALNPEEAFASFGDSTIITVVSVFVIAGALIRTGIADRIGQRIHRFVGDSKSKLLITLMLAVTCFSAFISNTATTAVFLPAAIGLARRARVSPSKLLIPVAYASMLGGTITLIGTSTNIAVNGVLKELGLEPFGLFEFTPLGLIIAAAGLLYMALIGSRLLPERAGESLVHDYGIKEYLTEVLILPNSALVGKTIGSCRLDPELGLKILGLVRDKRVIWEPNDREQLRPGDQLLVEGNVEKILQVRETEGLRIKADVRLEEEAGADTVRMIEAALSPSSHLIGRSLKEINFRKHYGLNALAIYRHGEAVREKVGRARLRFGDVLLIEGSEKRIERLRRDPNFIILSDIARPHLRRNKAKLALAIFVITLALGGIELIPLPVAVLCGALATVIARCLTIKEAYSFIDWSVVLLIAGMLSMGAAMDKTGASKMLAEQIVKLSSQHGPHSLLAMFFLFTALLTQPMKNNAAALVVAPVAISTANAIGANPRAFAMAVAVAASCSFVLPLEPACLLVYGPGKYRVVDFIKLGLGLTLLIFMLSVIFIPIFWPLR